MTTFNTLITDGDATNKLVTNALKAYVTSGNQLHLAVCVGVHNAMVGGNPAILNRIYPALRSNDQVALRQWVKRLNTHVGMNLSIIPDGLPAETLLAASESGAVLTFKDKSFSLVPAAGSPEKKKQREFAATVLMPLAAECGKGWEKKVFERNNFSEVKTYGDSEFIKAVAQVVEKFSKGTDTRKVNLSPKFMAKVNELGSYVENAAIETDDMPEAATGSLIRKGKVIGEAPALNS